MKKENPIDLIKNHEERFQVNFNLIKPRKKKYENLENPKRMINIDKYQTKKVIIDIFYKKISRTIR